MALFGLQQLARAPAESAAPPRPYAEAIRWITRFDEE